MKKSSIFWLVIVLLIALGGYALAYFQFRKSNALAEQLIKEDKRQIGLVESDIEAIREEKKLTLDELKKSKDRIDALITEFEQKDTTEMSVDDALKIIEGLK
jgi:hypothetical protein